MPSSPEFSAAPQDGQREHRLHPRTEAEQAAPIVEDESSISYLGVRLEKAHVPSDFVPDREKYADYIQDRFALELQQKIAVGFQSGDPSLIEGGTSIGKTTTVRKMCADLGWEVHYANLNGATDVEDLMGRYIPNPHRTKPDDPEFVFADGKVTAGLRQEDGKIKVVILDEYNAAAPNIVIRLHEVLDAMERDGEVVLSEDASESVPVAKAKTKIIALTNPPGKGYFGREPLDPAQLRRWVYLKEASDLPENTFAFSTKSLFGLAAGAEAIPQEVYLQSREEQMSHGQLAEIPGLAEIEAKYEEFHKGAKKLLGIRSQANPNQSLDRRIAADQPQPFTFDDRMEPRRVRDFVARFYNGDINETFQRALRYYYSNKLESAEDRQKLEELITHVCYIPQPDSRRKGLEDETDAEQAGSREKVARELEGILADPSIPEAVKEALRVGKTEFTADTAERITEYRAILGKDFIGPAEIKTAFDFEPDPSGIPEIPFDRDEILEAKVLGQMLVLRLGKAQDGTPMTMKVMDDILGGTVKDGGRVLFSRSWHKDEDFYEKEAVTPGWALVTKELIPESTSKNYIEQTEAVIDYLKNKVFTGKVMPKEYQDAIVEFEGQKEDISRIIDSDWETAAERLEKLSITQLTRQTPAEALYDLVATYQNNEERLLPEAYSWTSRRDSDGSLVSVGRFESDGVDVSYDDPGNRYDDLGVSFSRSL